MLEPLERSSLPDQAARAIKQFILNKQLTAGDQLPSERYLTELLGVSRTVVREALQMLVAEGLLTKEAGRGVFVRDFDPRGLTSQLDGANNIAAQTRNLMEVRAALEIGAITFVAQRATAAQLQRLTEIITAMRRRYEAGQAITVLDRELHTLLAEAAHNSSFTYFKSLVQDAIQAAAQLGSQVHVRPADRNSVETAEALLAALASRDVEAAQRAMRAHLLIDRPPDQARVFLFADDHEIASAHNLTRRIQPANKYPHNPVLCAEHSWEGDSLLPSATVFYDAERMSFHLWYHGHEQFSPREERFALCYATSLDGIHWTKPALGLNEYAGEAATNLVMPHGDPRLGDVTCASILHTATTQNHGPDYSMVYLGAGIHSAGVCVATSQDGLRWTAAADNPVDADGPEPVGDQLICLPDLAADKMVAYYRIPLRIRQRAALGRMESHDLHHWTDHRMVLAADERDPADAEFYGLTPFRYGECILGLLWVYRRTSGSIEMQLVCSRDGVDWTRVGDRTPFLPLGAPGAFDDHAVLRATVPVVVGNELWFYYAGASLAREVGAGWQRPASRIGLATLVLDRFVALAADAEEGTVTTRPLLCTDQTRLLLNAVANRDGYVLVEVLDAQGQPIAGFTRAEATRFGDNAVHHRVTWQAHDDLSALGGQMIQLRFILRQAAIYAYRLAHPNARNSDLIAGIC